VKWTMPSKQTRLRVTAAIILIVGFGSAISIYLTVASMPGNPLGYEPEASKQYIREMELYGGKANVLASELRHGFDRLWHGKRLALTVACITALVAGAFLLVATQIPPDVSPRASRDDNQGGTDP
jgi:hypothetical protein